jgi:hypothetical protein
MAFHQSKIYRALGGDPKLLEQFCERMDSAASARDLMDWVREHSPAAAARLQTENSPPTDQNITDFRQGYFARWQARREAAQTLRDRAAVARQLVGEARAGGASITEAAALSAAATIGEALETYTAADLRASLAENPADFFKAIGSLAQISRADLARKELEQRAALLEVNLAAATARLDQLRLDNERKVERLIQAVRDAGKANGGALTGAEVRAKIKEIYGA